MYICLRRSYGAKRLKYTRLQVFLLFIDAGLGTTHLGGSLALGAGGRRQLATKFYRKKVYSKDYISSYFTRVLKHRTLSQSPLKSSKEKLLKQVLIERSPNRFQQAIHQIYNDKEKKMVY